MTHLRIISACLLATWLLAGLAHASAPHPRVRRMIMEGIIPEPYYLKHLHELRQAGLNAPWVRRPPVGLHKILGPDRFTGKVPGQPLTGTLNALVILVDFSDSTHKADAADFDSLVFAESYPSVRDYYRAVSYRNLDIVTVNLPGQLGWMRADSAYTFYITDSLGEGHNGIGNYPRNAQKLVEEAVLAVDSLVDFGQYDNDKNGYVDGLIIVHAGTGGEATGSDNDIWSHAWATYRPIPLGTDDADSVLVYPYAMVPEYWLFDGAIYDMTIGVYAHELGHALFGLPDLYDRDDPDGPSASSGLDLWSLMAAGSWLGPVDPRTGYMLGGSPAFPDAWCRQQMGYATTHNVTADSLNRSIVNAAADPDIYRLWTGGVLGEEYFLVENRQLVGYDAYLPGSGLLIYHIDENVATQNDNEWYPGHTGYGHYLVALEQADGWYDLERDEWADEGDPFPGSTQNTGFYDFSTPSSRSYSGKVTSVAVANISDSNLVMFADFRLLQPVAPPAIQAVYDVPGDQGEAVIVTWEPSPDEGDTLRPILSYGIWLLDIADTSTSGWESIYLEDGRWLKIGVVDSLGDTLYDFTAPTFGDSDQVGISWSYFRVSAHAEDPLLTSFSAPVSGYSVDNSAIAAVVFHTAALPRSYVLHPNYPNPFNPGTTLRFDLPEAAMVSVMVYDLRGREVSRLVDGLCPSGCHEVLWDGRSADGQALPSGIYFARLTVQPAGQARLVIPPTAGETPGFSSSVKMLLLR